VIEVTDPDQLEYVLGRAIEAVNRKAAEEGKPSLRLGQEEANGRRFLTISSESSTLAVMTFEDGYLLAGPSRAILLDAIASRAAGSHLSASRAFQDLLPSDAETDFSALVWQNLGGVAGPLGDLLGSALDDSERAQIEALAGDIGPMLVLAYGDADAVRLVARGGSGPFGFSFEKILALAGIIGEKVESSQGGATGDGVKAPARTTA